MREKKKTRGLTVDSLPTPPTQVRCYLRLSDNARARDALRQCLPDPLRDETFAECLRDDQTTKKWLQQLNFVVSDAAPPPHAAINNGLFLGQQ